jgi:receptor protein-tyrosine kinase
MNSKTYKFGKEADGTRRRTRAAAKESYVAGVPLARVIPRELDDRVESVMTTAPDSLAAERFRRLATKLDARTDEGQVIVVTSSIPHEGKTTVSMNLAMAFAVDADGETLIVDADLRRPCIHKWLKQPPALGLTEVLSGTIGLEHAIHDLRSSNLKILPAGTACADPLELIGSRKARELFQDLRQRYRHIVIDTPPVVPFTDATAVAKYGDGVVLVARAGLTARKAYENAVGLLKSEVVLGVVLNEYAHNVADGHLDYSDYYSTYYSKERRE